MDRVCSECGKMFTAKMKRQKFCCYACKRKSYRKKVEIEKHTPVDYCIVCGDKLSESARSREFRFCSIECRRSWEEVNGHEREDIVEYHISEEERIMMGLPKGKTGNVKCLQCGREFLSEDVKKKRICPACSIRNKAISREHFLCGIGGY